MNREIKFRAWDKKERTMRTVINLFANGHVYVDCQCNETDKLKYHRDKNRFNLPHHLSSKDVDLMQYTGLHDRNAKEIYEGDIIEWMRRDGKELLRTVFVVEWRNGRYIERAIGGPSDGQEDCVCEHESNKELHAACIAYHSVIGNIYENPGLLTSTSVA